MHVKTCPSLKLKLWEFTNIILDVWNEHTKPLMEKTSIVQFNIHLVTTSPSLFYKWLSAESAAVVLCNCDSVIVTFVLYVATSGPLEWTEAWNNISNLYEHQHPFIWLTAGDLQKLLPLETSSTAGDGHPITDALYVCQKIMHDLFPQNTRLLNVSQWIKKLLAAKWCSNQYWPAKLWPATGLVITLNH